MLSIEEAAQKVSHLSLQGNNSADNSFESLPEILTALDIAKYLHISRRRVYELFQIDPAAGGIPNFDIGFSKRVDKQDFIAWINSLKVQKQQQQKSKSA
jgi:hypothetical protein